MDLKHLSALLDLLTEKEVGEFQYKDSDYSLKLRLGPVHIAAPLQMAAPVAVASGAAAVDAAVVEEAHTLVNSPMVGTFYRSPGPDAAVYVSVGDSVTKGQTLCIIEAMKLMNEIEAEESGVVVEIMVKNAEPVQFGQVLFKVTPA